MGFLFNVKNVLWLNKSWKKNPLILFISQLCSPSTMLDILSFKDLATSFSYTQEVALPWLAASEELPRIPLCLFLSRRFGYSKLAGGSVTFQASAFDMGMAHRWRFDSRSPRWNITWRPQNGPQKEEFMFFFYFKAVRLQVAVAVVDFVSTWKLGNSGRWGGGKTIKNQGLAGFRKQRFIQRQVHSLLGWAATLADAVHVFSLLDVFWSQSSLFGKRKMIITIMKTPQRKLNI